MIDDNCKELAKPVLVYKKRFLSLICWVIKHSQKFFWQHRKTCFIKRGFSSRCYIHIFWSRIVLRKMMLLTLLWNWYVKYFFLQKYDISDKHFSRIQICVKIISIQNMWYVKSYANWIRKRLSWHHHVGKIVLTGNVKTNDGYFNPKNSSFVIIRLAFIFRHAV